MMFHPVGYFFPLDILFGIGFIFMLIVAVAVVLLAWAFRAHPVPNAGLPAPQAPARETPLEILARRFASGEISAEEYERARKILGG